VVPVVAIIPTYSYPAEATDRSTYKFNGGIYYEQKIKNSILVNYDATKPAYNRNPDLLSNAAYVGVEL
jgi:hypothetical protein